MSFPSPDASPLVVFTHVPHYLDKKGIMAHGPYVKEINLLAKGRDLVIVGPVIKNTLDISADNILYEKQPARIVELPVVGGSGIGDKLKYLWYFPVLVYRIAGAIREGGILHPRCPGSVALIAIVLISLIGRSKRKFVRFTGEWDNPASMPITFRLQRWWVSKQWLFNGPVFAYTDKPNPRHVLPCFTSSLSNDEIARAAVRVAAKRFDGHLTIAFAGRLVENKGVDVLIEALSIFNKAYQSWNLLVMGDGSEKERLTALSQKYGIADRISWLGWCAEMAMRENFTSAHVVCQPTRYTESWGKVLQEGMAYGCIPVASAVGGLKRQLASRQELLFSPGNPAACASILMAIFTGKTDYLELKNWSLQEARRYSIDGLSNFIWNKFSEYYND